MALPLGKATLKKYPAPKKIAKLRKNKNVGHPTNPQPTSFHLFIAPNYYPGFLYLQEVVFVLLQLPC